MTNSNHSLKLLEAGIVNLLHLGEDAEGIVGIAAQMGDGIAVGIASEGCTVCLATVLVAGAIGLQSALAHHAFADDECRLVLHSLSLLDGTAYLLHIVAVNLYHLPLQCAVLGGSILVHHHIGLGGELYVVGIIEHDEVVQSQRSCYACSTHAYLLLYASIADIGIDGLLAEGRIAGACSQELGGNGSTYCVGMTLSQGAGTILNAALDAYFGVTGCG